MIENSVESFAARFRVVPGRGASREQIFSFMRFQFHGDEIDSPVEAGQQMWLGIEGIDLQPDTLVALGEPEDISHAPASCDALCESPQAIRLVPSALRGLLTQGLCDDLDHFVGPLIIVSLPHLAVPD